MISESGRRWMLFVNPDTFIYFLIHLSSCSQTWGIFFNTHTHIWSHKMFSAYTTMQTLTIIFIGCMYDNPSLVMFQFRILMVWKQYTVSKTHFIFLIWFFSWVVTCDPTVFHKGTPISHKINHQCICAVLLTLCVFSIYQHAMGLIEA